MTPFFTSTPIHSRISARNLFIMSFTLPHWTALYIAINKVYIIITSMTQVLLTYSGFWSRLFCAHFERAVFLFNIDLPFFDLKLHFSFHHSCSMCLDTKYLVVGIPLFACFVSVFYSIEIGFFTEQCWLIETNPSLCWMAAPDRLPMTCGMCAMVQTE